MEEIEKGKRCVAIHNDAVLREKWCRTSYNVTVIEGGEEFDCECGQFAHMGLLCSHILKVIYMAVWCAYVIWSNFHSYRLDRH